MGKVSECDIGFLGNVERCANKRLKMAKGSL